MNETSWIQEYSGLMTLGGSILSPFILAGVARTLGWVGNVAKKSDLEKLQGEITADIREARADIRDIRNHLMRKD